MLMIIESENYISYTTMNNKTSLGNERKREGSKQGVSESGTEWKVWKRGMTTCLHFLLGG